MAPTPVAVQTTATTGLTPTPAINSLGLQANDLILVVANTGHSATATVGTLPSGYTQELWAPTANGSSGVWWAIATGSDTNPQFSITGGAVSGWTVYRITGHDPSDPIDGTPTTSSNATASTTIDIAAFTTSGADRLLVVGHAHKVSIGTDTTGSWSGSLQEAADFTIGTSSTNWRNVAAATLAAATATTYGPFTATSDNAQSGVSHAVTLAVNPAPSGSTETLRPTTGGATTNFETYDHTKIDQDPNDATITDAGLSPVVDP